MGGVGNQLFQYAAGMGLSQRTGASVVVDRSNVEGLCLPDLLPEGTVEVASLAERRRFGMSNGADPMSTRAAMLLWRTALERSRRLTVVLESKSGGAEVPTQIAHRCLLVGWFMNPDWFGSSREAVASLVRRRLETHPAYTAARSSGAAVVSFRRGDFVRWGLDLSLDYYERSLKHLRGATGPVWLVGDDQLFLEFASRWFADRGVTISPLPAFEGSAGITDLALLAGAQTVVMSNSTFCWWGVSAGDTAGHAARTIVLPDLSLALERVREGTSGTSGRWGPPHWERVPAGFGKGAG